MKKFILADRTKRALLQIFALSFFLLGFTFGIKAQTEKEINDPNSAFNKKYANFSNKNLEFFRISSSTGVQKKEIAMITIKAKKTAEAPSLPPWFVIGINGKKVRAADNGEFPDAKKGDGIYTIMGTPKSPSDAPGTVTYKVQNNELISTVSTDQEPTSPVGRFVIKCHAHITTHCPSDCRSVLFGTDCILCVEIVCDVTWEDSWGNVSGKSTK